MKQKPKESMNCMGSKSSCLLNHNLFWVEDNFSESYPIHVITRIKYIGI